MTELKNLLEHRKRMKKKKPNFVRQEYKRRGKLSETWRRPRGVHSKLRLRRRGKPARVAVGYGTLRKVRNLTPEGLKKVIISNSSDLKNLKEDEISVISRTVGTKKKLEILKEAQKSNIKIHNFPKIKETIDKIENKIKQKKEAKKEKAKEKKGKKKEEKPKEEPKKEEKKADDQKSEKKEEVKDEPKTPEKASK
ncbi:MAG: 50S ribosomal protein L32e [Candidatus Woesearchaeota archaeon]|nr:MAG: 50S ribosomal protein L32e [Candidatus Woesearchaeota archaeon]